MAYAHSNPTTPHTAKSILVFRNGDQYYKGRRFVVNSKQTRTWDAFLNLVTNGIAASFGAVRKVHTPRFGRRVDKLEAVESGKCYVAAGLETFKPIDYATIGYKKVVRRTRVKPIRPVLHSRIKTSARCLTIIQEPLSIFIYSNGNEHNPPVKLFTQRKLLRDWDAFLTIVNDRVKLYNGAVRRIYYPNGKRVKILEEIINGGRYVATGSEKFKKLSYVTENPLPEISPRRMLPKVETPGSSPGSPRREGGIMKIITPREQGRQSYSKKDPHLLDAGVDILGPRPLINRTQNDEIFKGKNGQRKPKNKGNSLDFDDGGVFRVTHPRQETRGAHEISDTPDTAIDLPIDMISAQEVDEDLAADVCLPDPPDGAGNSREPSPARPSTFTKGNVREA